LSTAETFILFRRKLATLKRLTCLTACAPAAAQTADHVQPTATRLLTLPPAPELTALQEKIAQSQDYTLMPDGSLEYQSKDGAVVVPGITVNPQTAERSPKKTSRTSWRFGPSRSKNDYRNS
jgi:hypothetical protein